MKKLFSVGITMSMIGLFGLSMAFGQFLLRNRDLGIFIKIAQLQTHTQVIILNSSSLKELYLDFDENSTSLMHRKSDVNVKIIETDDEPYAVITSTGIGNCKYNINVLQVLEGVKLSVFNEINNVNDILQIFDELRELKVDIYIPKQDMEVLDINLVLNDLTIDATLSYEGQNNIDTVNIMGGIDNTITLLGEYRNLNLGIDLKDKNYFGDYNQQLNVNTGSDINVAIENYNNVNITANTIIGHINVEDSSIILLSTTENFDENQSSITINALYNNDITLTGNYKEVDVYSNYLANINILPSKDPNNINIYGQDSILSYKVPMETEGFILQIFEDSYLWTSSNSSFSESEYRDGNDKIIYTSENTEVTSVIQNTQTMEDTYIYENYSIKPEGMPSTEVDVVKLELNDNSNTQYVYKNGYTEVRIYDNNSNVQFIQ